MLDRIGGVAIGPVVDDDLGREADAAGRLIGSDSSGPRLTYRRAGDDKLNSSAARAARNQQYYVRNWQGQARGRG
ncbi:hypothetical protein [Amaricoccus solimangrovi]|uniref:Uncharacterized protein n=1 Tax=Amaricoccus solimangrovi TaxID=2589815 RepID=A0A501WFG5_9RHOB|nr:hypothetical protein [Amaricoccus solimangrovi]TPE48158.1 hypothetical protein FJM51_18315 [Amaricoccus solimangrovi]